MEFKLEKRKTAQHKATKECCSHSVALWLENGIWD